MATTNTPSGTISLTASLFNTFTGDSTGNRSQQVSVTKLLDSVNTPIAGFFKGEAIAAAGDWLLAHASDPLSGMGDAAYSDGFTVSGKKLTLLLIVNKDATNSITITRKTAAGLPIFEADGDAIIIKAGGIFMYFNPTGTAALTTTVNDGLTIAVSGGTPACDVMAAYRS